MNPLFNTFQKQIINPVKFRLFMLQRLPAAFFAGLRIHSFNEQQAMVTVRYKWFNQNPFGSMYFAVQSMAAEMSTGLLASGQVFKRDPAVSMLVVGLEASFFKRATGMVFFSCTDGAAIDQSVEAAITSGEAKTINCLSTGTNQEGEKVSEFRIMWSFKVKQHQPAS